MPTVPTPSRRNRVARRAAATVEFAVVAPVLILLIFGMLEFSRLMMVEQILTNAAREGSRKAVLAGSKETDVTSVISSYLDGSGIKGAKVKVSPDPGSAAGGAAVTVTVEVPFSDVSWLPHAIFLQNTTVRASVVMRKETNNT